MKALLIPVLLFALPAHALTIYDDRSRWEEDAGAFALETFEDVPAMSVPRTGGVLGLQHFDIHVDGNHGGIGIDAKGAITGEQGMHMDVHYFAEPEGPYWIDYRFDTPKTAFGADFDETVDAGSVTGLTVMSFTINGLGVPISTGDKCSFSHGSVPCFRGVVSDTPFDHVRFKSTNVGNFAMDNVVVAPGGPIPEPKSGLLFLLGLGIVWWQVQRSRSPPRVDR